jgi:hypothetical protein
VFLEQIIDHFSHRKDGGFDIIKVRVQQLRYEEIDYLKSQYTVAHERIDISIMFFELALRFTQRQLCKCYSVLF